MTCNKVKPGMILLNGQGLHLPNVPLKLSNVLVQHTEQHQKNLIVLESNTEITCVPKIPGQISQNYLHR